MLRIQLDTKINDGNYEQVAAKEIAERIEDLKIVQKSLNEDVKLNEIDEQTRYNILNLNFSNLTIECFSTKNGDLFIEVS